MRAFAFACCLTIATPLAAAADPDRIARGAALYDTHCLECHGPTAVESPVGDIRGLSLSTVTGAVRGGPGRMPVLGLDADEIAAVVAFLASLQGR